MNTLETERPLRIGFVVHVMQVAGAEVLVRETIRQLGSRIIPTIFCLDRLGTIGEELRADGVDIVVLNRKPGWDFSVSKRLASEAKTRNIEVFHAHQYTPFFYTALAKLLIQPMPRVILTEHGRHYPDLVSPLRRAINRLVFDRLADDVNACIGFSAKALCRIDGFRGRRIHVIENGIHVENYGPPEDLQTHRMKLGLDPARRYIIHVARHHPVKDQPTLLRGFAMCANRLPDVDLIMVGDGPQRAELESLCAELKITGRVKFLGIRKDVADVLRAADVFALTSVSEAASLTLLEAMATGLPVVVSDVGGNPDIVRAGVDGLLFPRGDHHRCGEAFVKLLSDRALLMALGANARERTHQRYRLEHTVGSYHELYRRLAARH